MRTYTSANTFELEDKFEIELEEGEVIITDNGEEYEDCYSLFLEVEYEYSLTTGIPYENRVYAQDYEEDCEVTDIILLEGFTWNGKTYEEGKSIYEYPELLDFINESWIDEKAFEEAQENMDNEW
jgi:hypothetical protein